MLRYDIIFTGRVQGVWFRATTQEVAAGFPVSGWVRNESDGSVRCVAEGEEAALDAFVAAVQEAKRGNIDDTRIDRRPATGEFDGFAVRR
jgi:acylphosphatase